MCGIAGMVDPSGRLDDPKEALRGMVAALGHRGPDGSGIAELAPAWLGHARLAILDPEGGRQPIATADGAVTASYNGELYNYPELRRELEADGVRFRTGSDAEVLPHLYRRHGTAMLGRLRGMFALAVWDRDARRLLLARDRIGIKPLHYRADARGIAFASEIGALLAHPWTDRIHDDEAIAEYFLLNHVPAPLTAWRGVRKLEPAGWLTWTDGRIETGRWWDLEPVSPEPPPVDEEAALAELDRRLAECVRAHLLSDVPVGALLSGGIDSGLVVSYMAEASSRPVATFSIGFAERSHDELELARAVARRYGTDHHEQVATPDQARLLERLTPRFGEPFGDSSAVPTLLVAELARSRVKVALSGDGGDEAFAGYPRYRKAAAIERVAALVPRAWLGAAAAALAPFDARAARGARRMLRRARLPFPEAWLDGVSYVETGAVPDAEPALAAARARIAARFRGLWRGERAARAAQYLDLRTNLPDGILTKVDRASMAVSLEVRPPLLDHTLLEWANRLPLHLKLRRGTTKHLLRRLAARRLGAAHAAAPKRGFDLPVAGWLRGPLREPLADHVLGPSARSARWLGPRRAARLVERHLAGVEDHSHALWSVLAFELWARG